MSATVSVIVPTYNYGKFINEALRSVFRQTYPVTEVIVVDDGSTDDTAKVVAQFGDSVKYIWQENAGVSVARNRGVAESCGELIAFLDADDVWEPTKLEKQAAKFASDREIGLVHCGMHEFDGETGKTIATHLDGMEGHVAEALLLWEQPVIVGPGGTIMVSRAAFEHVGGFDPRQKCGEDRDFCYRMAKEYLVGFIAEPLVNYRNHGNASHRNVRELEKGMGLFYEKAFAAGGDVSHLRCRAMGNYHRILSGSYFHAGNYKRFARHAILCFYYRPSLIVEILGYSSRNSY